MDVSIILVNYNTLDITKDCIDSIVKKTVGCSYEIILVDNASTDGSKKFFEVHEKVRYVYNNENIGFGRANNIGIQYATGDYVLFLNSDTLLINDAVSEFVKIAKRKESENISVGVLGCMLYDSSGNYIHSYGTSKKAINTLFVRIKSAFYSLVDCDFNDVQGDSAKSDFFKVGYVTGADLFVSRSLLIKLGGFDPDFFMYSEDCYLQYKYNKAGYGSYITTVPQIIHLESVSTNNQKGVKNYRKMMMMQKSDFLYYRKTLSRLSYYVFRLCFFIIRLPYCVFANLAPQQRCEYFKFLLS